MDRPILFSAAMVRALLEGRKTQTRRVIKPQPKISQHHEPVRVEKSGERRWVWMVHTDRPAYQFATGDWKAPYAVGDRLWVRESIDKMSERGDAEIGYRADWPGDGRGLGWRPSIHMPRWASRLTLTVTEVRVQRLQRIDADDCYAEGVKCDMSTRGVIEHFRNLWDRINADRGFGWDANPWVVAVSFTVERRNIDGVA